MELKKVTWPSRKETFGATAVVLALVFLISFYLGLVDIGADQDDESYYRLRRALGLGAKMVCGAHLFRV